MYLRRESPMLEPGRIRQTLVARCQLKTLGGKGKNKKVVPVFHKPAVLHVLGFLLPEEDVARCTRVLDSVPRKYWKPL